MDQVEIEQTNIIKEDTQKKTSQNKYNEITEDNCKFKDGDKLRLVRVRFPGHAKSYPFLIGKRSLMYGQKVMAMSDRGLALGYINSFAYEAAFNKNMLPLRYINKVATDEDIAKELDVYKKQKHAETLCQSLIEKHNLDMNMTHVEFTGFGKKVVFYFVAPARVDFRELVKDLVSELKLRIELRQISLRDRAASMGALGPCGRELCCSSFLSKYGNVSIKMAKNQNLSINYSKLNGACGQLKCCLQYEDEVYAQKRKFLPNEGSFIETKNGDKGKVFRLNILAEQFDLLTEKGRIKRFVAEQFNKYLDNFSMPRKFDHIADETGTIIGLNELNQKKEDIKENLHIKSYNESIDYAHDTFENLMEVKTTKKAYKEGFDKELTKISKANVERPSKDTDKKYRSDSKRDHKRDHRKNLGKKNLKKDSNQENKKDFKAKSNDKKQDNKTKQNKKNHNKRPKKNFKKKEDN
ncbi:MAG: hypothetical protein N4A33_00120 [Bacteriovoracaceae bacterium]|jgi:cell fate regulator YaaT (PSP1 superfamily)|nr:hypothetical protein [Bacteriovoracaceae bacterium]